jgi:hypothetical protein
MLLRRGIGRVSVEEARLFATADDFFVRPGSGLVTTREVLAEEAALLATVKAGQGGYAELGSDILTCAGINLNLLGGRSGGGWWWGTGSGSRLEAGRG